jgi:hypothetical protein
MRKATTRAVPCSNRAVPRNPVPRSRALQGEGPIMAQVAQVVRASPTGMTTVRTKANPEIRTRALAHTRIWICTTATAVAGQARNSRAGTKTFIGVPGISLELPVPLPSTSVSLSTEAGLFPCRFRETCPNFDSSFRREFNGTPVPIFRL